MKGRKKLRVLLLTLLVFSLSSINVYAADDIPENNTSTTSTANEEIVLGDAPIKTISSVLASKVSSTKIVPTKDSSLHEKDEEVKDEEKEVITVDVNDLPYYEDDQLLYGEEAEDEAEAEEEAEKDKLPYFGDDGLLVEEATDAAQDVINLLCYIPGHCNGASYHASTGLDDLIDELSVEECVYVIHRIEGAGFGQTSAGYAGYDTYESHLNFLNQQIIDRFDGSIWELLKHWGTYSYDGY